MKPLVTLVFLLFGLGVESQTLVDSKLEQYARHALVDGIKDYGDDVNQAGIVIMEVNTGNVVANVSLGQFRGKVKDIPDGNSEAVPPGISRAVLYLSMIDILGPDFLVETGNGLYVDSISGCSITDISYKRGGFGTLTLKKAFDLSDVGIIKAAEIAFNRNIVRYGAALKKTGILFEKIDDENDYSQEDDSLDYWPSCEIIGYRRSPFSLYQQTAWINMVANQGILVMRFNKNDPTTPICEVKNKAGIDSLGSAMFEAVENGTGSKMKSKYIRVAGLVNVSPADAINCRGCFAAAFFPYDDPQYTIGLYVNKHDRPAGRNIASKIAGRIIDFMIKEYLHLQHADDIFSERNQLSEYHPADK